MVKDTKDIFSQKSPQVRKCYACGVNTTWWLDIQVDMQPPVYNKICVNCLEKDDLQIKIATRESTTRSGLKSGSKK